MFDLILLQPGHNFMEIKKILHNPQQKKFCVNYDQTKSFNIITSSAKYEFFLTLYQLTFFLAFGQAKRFFRYLILINILSVNYYKYFVTEKSLNSIPYRKSYH